MVRRPCLRRCVRRPPAGHRGGRAASRAWRTSVISFGGWATRVYRAVCSARSNACLSRATVKCMRSVSSGSRLSSPWPVSPYHRPPGVTFAVWTTRWTAITPAARSRARTVWLQGPAASRPGKLHAAFAYSAQNTRCPDSIVGSRSRRSPKPVLHGMGRRPLRPIGRIFRADVKEPEGTEPAIGPRPAAGPVEERSRISRGPAAAACATSSWPPVLGWLKLQLWFP